MNDTNKRWEITVLEDLNESKISQEEHSSIVLSKLDKILELNCSEDINKIVDDIFEQIQHTDLNRQKIERAMNLLIENCNISRNELDNVNIKSTPSAKHIDNNDGDTISDDELAKLIAEANN